ncbi:MAG: ABC transporter substrate-binding protein [Cryobacterium sp.]
MTHHAFPTVMAAGAIALALVLTGCTTPQKEPKPTASPTVTAAPVVASGDGVLRVGTLFPMTGESAAQGAAEVAGTELAAREVFEQGGVLGNAVDLVHRNSAGDLDAAITDLVARGVDVVLWDATSEIPKDAATAIDAADIALLQLGAFVRNGSPVTPGTPFMTRLGTADPGLTAFLGGAEAYDGMVTAALAATVADDDGGPSVASKLESVTTGPTACTSWGECLAALADKQEIRFVGATGERS